MQALKSSFEASLKEKARQKATGVKSEEQIVMLNFKFFDVNNSGSLSIDEFRKAIERIGIQIPTQQVSTFKLKTLFILQDVQALFDLYDKDGSGAINYVEFGEAIYGRNNLIAAGGALEQT